MASSFGMINFNSTILAFVPIVSHILLAEIFVGRISSRSKTRKSYGIYFRKSRICQNFAE